MKQLVVLCGGRSAEHEVSLVSAASVLENLDSSRFRISVLGIRKDGSTWKAGELRDSLRLLRQQRFIFPDPENWVCFLAGLHRTDCVVFPVLHGPNGEDGAVQGLLEVIGLAYVGAGVGGSAVAMNKAYTKRILSQTGIPVLPFVEFDRREAGSLQKSLQETEKRLDYPVFVKPANMGSSIGVSKCGNCRQLEEALEKAFLYDDVVLVEQGIEAREIEVSVLGNLERRVSIPGEIIPSEEFYTYHAKYHSGESRLLIPAPLSEKETLKAQKLAQATCRALHLEGMARVDLLMEKSSGRMYVNEPNTIPGFTQISMFPKLWEASGVGYPKLLEELIELALERHHRRGRLSVDPVR